jgi:hypothetical protein
MKKMIQSPAVFVPVLLLLVPACWDSSAPSEMIDGAEDIMVEVDDPGREVHDPVHDDPVHEDIRIDEIAEERVEELCTAPICAADFPCRADSVCQSEGTLLRCRTIPCEEVCGTPCCIGASCGTQSTETCPEGTTCHQLIDGCSMWPTPAGNAARCLTPGTVEEDGQTWIEPETYCSYCS